METATWKLTIKEIHASALEVAWETDAEGNEYHWTQARPDATCLNGGVLSGTNASYIEALTRVFNELKAIQAAGPDGGVNVVRLNVTEEGGMSFLATPALPVKDAITTIDSTLRLAVQNADDQYEERHSTSNE